MIKVAEMALLAAALLFVSACSSSEEGAGREDAARAPAAGSTEASTTAPAGPPPVSGDTATTESGLRYIVIQSGDGERIQDGQVAVVHYTGWFTDGRKFDSSLDRGEPFPFPLGAGRVISGWDEGVALMRIGDKRRFIVPPQLGYGEAGHPAGIPPNATLIFDVELLGVQER